MEVERIDARFNGWFSVQVFKGKKMAGHMGAVRRTVKNVWIYKIEPERDLIWVRGQVF